MIGVRSIITPNRAKNWLLAHRDCRKDFYELRNVTIVYCRMHLELCVIDSIANYNIDTLLGNNER